MGWDHFSLALLGALGVLLVSAGVEDARRREIANWKNAAIAALAPAFWWSSGLSFWPDMAVQVAVASLVFGLFCIAFHFGQMGGGDVKLIGALALWLPPMPLLGMLLIMSIVGGIVTIVMIVEKKLKKNEALVEIPYGVAIAVAGLLSLREPLFNQLT